MSNREIGDELFISDSTVKNHIRNTLEKLTSTLGSKRSSTPREGVLDIPHGQ